MKNKYFLLFLIPVFIFLFFTFFFLKKNYYFKSKNNKPQLSLTKVKLAMGYIPNVQFAPFYVAVEKGYFTQEGIDIEFNYGWEADIITLLAQNEIQFAIGSGEQVIIARSQGLPVINFFNWYQNSPLVITSLKENNIEQPQDLLGKTVGIPAVQGASYIGWQAFLKKTGLENKKINLKVIGYTQAAALKEKRVQAAVCYKMNEPVQLEEAGYKINNLPISQWVNLVSNGLLTNEKILQEKPQLVKGFANAFLKGLKDTINNPQESFIIAKKFIPEMKDEETQKMVLKESISFWDKPPLGKNNQKQWQETIILLKELGIITKEPSLETLFTNQFIEE